MPLTKIEVRGENRAWGLWKIQETESELIYRVGQVEKVPSQITHQNKRLEFLAGRVLVQTLLEKMGLPFTGIIKDAFGKPFLKDQSIQLSLSHSYPYVAAVLDGNVAGIDVEQPKEKLLRIASRIMHITELTDAGNDITKHCVYWCAKEALVKIHGKKDLIFAENLQIEPFTRNQEGFIIGKIIVNNTITTHSLKYLVEPDYVVVFNQ